MVDKNMLGSNLIQHNQYHTVAKMKHIDLKTIKMLCSPTIYEEADNMMRAHKATILKSVDERVEAELKINGFVYPLVIQKNDERNFDTSCTCAETMHPLCEHKVLLFLQLLNAFGANYFDSIRNWDKEKNKLLQIYGYTLNDDLTGKFEFSYKEGKPFLKLLDPSIKRVAQQPVQETKSSIQNVNYTKTTVQTVVAEKPITKKKLGLVINFNQQNFPGLLFDAIYGEANQEHNKFVGKVEAIDLTKYVNTELFDDADKYFFQQIRKLQSTEINKYLSRNSPFSGIWENIIQNENEDLPEETQFLIVEYLHPKLKKVFEEQNTNQFVFLLKEKKKFITANLKEVELSDQFLTPLFKFTTLSIAARHGACIFSRCETNFAMSPNAK
jgi:non-specific serine/threonine protein kinase